jgi:lipopolysaccharide transport system permease protein
MTSSGEGAYNDLMDLNNASEQIIEIRPARGLFDLDLGDVWRYRELLFYLVWRDIKVRYKQAAFGAGWAIIQPLFAVAIFTVIFGRFAKIPSDGIAYPVFAYAALLPWTYFAESLRRSGTGLVTEAGLISKIYFPRLIIPLAGVITPLVDFTISFVVLLLLMAFYGMVPTWNIVFLPVLIFIALALALAVGLLLGPVNVRFRDVMHTLPFITQIWMYSSPIIYPLSLVPEQWRTLYSLNPMVGVIEGFRWALLGKQNPDFLAMGMSLFIIMLALIAGLVFFKKNEPSFVDVI